MAKWEQAPVVSNGPKWQQAPEITQPPVTPPAASQFSSGAGVGGTWTPPASWPVEIGRAVKRGTLRTAAAAPGRLASVMQVGSRAPYGWYPRSPEIEQQTQESIVALRSKARDLYTKAAAPELAPTKGGALGYVANLTFETVPQMGASVLAAILGGPVGVVVVSGAIGSEEVYQNLRDLGVDENTAEAGAWIAAPIIGLLEKWQVDEVLKVSNKAALRDLVAAAREKAWKKLAKAGGKIGATELVHAGSEGLQEALQEATNIGAEVAFARDFDWQEDLTRTLRAGAAGATLSGAFRGSRAAVGGPGRLLGERSRQRAVDKLTQPLDLETSLGVPTFPGLTEGGTTPTTPETKMRMTVEADAGPVPTPTPTTPETKMRMTVEADASPVPTPTPTPAPTVSRPAELTQPIGTLTRPIAELSTAELEWRVNRASPYHRWYKLELDIRKKETTPQSSPGPVPTIGGTAPDPSVSETVAEPPGVKVNPGPEPSGPDQVSFRNANIEQQRQAHGLPPVPEAEVAGSAEQRLQAAKDAGLADIDTARSVAADIINTGRMASDIETHGLHVAWDALGDRLTALEEQMASASYESGDFKAAEQDYNTLKQQYDLIGQAGKYSGSMWSRIGWARQTVLGDSGSYAGVLARAKREIGRDLTQAEEQQVRKKVSDYRKGREEAATAATEDAENRLRGHMKRQTAARKRGNKLGKLARLAQMTTEERDAQLQDLLGRELTDVTLTDIFMNLASRSEDPSIDETVGQVRALLPNVTHAQIVDAFDNLGRRKVRNTSGVEHSLRWLRGQLKKEKSKLTTIDDLLYWLNEGRLPDETGPSLELDDRVVRDLEEVVQQAKKLQRDSEPYLQRKLEKHIAYLEGRLAAKDWGTKKEAPAFTPSKYTLDLQYRQAGLRAEIGKEIARMKPRGGPVRRAGANVLRSVQAIKSSFDNSGLLNQGGTIAWAHPIKAAKTLPKAFQAALSPRKAFEIEQQIRNRMNAPLYQKYGLELTQSTERSVFTDREEEFRPSLADYIPGVKASNRMFATTLNILRADAFDAMVGQDAGAVGLTDVEGQAVADFVNIATGRGNIRGFESTVHALNGIFWAPRRTISNFQMLGTAGGLIEWGVRPGDSRFRPGVHLRGTKEIRRAIAAELARSLMGRSAAMFLATVGLGAEFEWDPRSSDFLKLRWGNLRLDPMSGLSQTMTILSRLPGQKKDVRTGRIEDLSSYDKEAMATRFARYKLAPGLGIAWSLWTGRTPFDGELEGGWDTALWTVKEAVVPISIDDVLKAAEDQGIPRATIFSMWGMLGVGVQVYGDAPSSGSGSGRIYGSVY